MAKSNCHRFVKQIIVNFRVRIWKNCSADNTYIHYIHTMMADSSRGSRKKSSIFWDTFVSACGTLVSCPTSGAAEKKHRWQILILYVRCYWDEEFSRLKNVVFCVFSKQPASHYCSCSWWNWFSWLITALNL